MNGDDRRMRTVPTVVIGMHRSGTTLMTAILARLGCFMGTRRDGNEEAVFFLRINEWILRTVGGSWEAPELLEWVEHDSDVERLLATRVEGTVRSPRLMEYLGPQQFLRHRSLWNLPFAWGWKDPRTTLTLPIWMRIIPEAYVIHVYRDPVEVVASLRSRADAAVQSALACPWPASLRRGPAVTSSPEYIGGVRLRDETQGFRLWHDYTRRALEYRDRPRIRLCEVSYSDLVASPEEEIDRVARFAGLPASRPTLRSAAALVRPRKVGSRPGEAVALPADVAGLWQRLRAGT